MTSKPLPWRDTHPVHNHVLPWFAKHFPWRRRLLRRRSVTDTAIRPSPFLGATNGGTFADAGESYRRDRCPPSVARTPATAITESLYHRLTGPLGTSPLNPIFKLSGCPESALGLTGTGSDLPVIVSCEHIEGHVKLC